MTAYRLSPQQRRAWSLGGEQYFAERTWEISGPLDTGRLFNAASAVVARHEILRTALRPVPEYRWPAQYVLDEPQALRIELVPLGPERHQLRLAAPAWFTDRRSLAIAGEELIDHYDGRAPRTQDPPQYADLAEAFNELVESDGPGRRYWREPRAPDFLILPDQPGVVHHRWALGPSLIARIEAEPDITAEDFVLAAWCALLSRLAETDRGVVGVFADGRTHPRLTDALGPLERCLPVTFELEGRFRDAARAIARARAEAEQWQDYAGDRELEEEPRDAPRFAFEAEELGPARTALGARFECSGARSVLERLSMKLTAISREGRLRELQLLAATAEDAELMRERLDAVLESASAERDRSLADLDFIGAEERRSLIGSVRSRRAAPLFPDAFEARARATPQAIAVSCGPQRLSYAELDRRARAYANVLAAEGVGPNVPVGICMERSISMLIAILAVSKAGGAFVPLDPSAPRERLARMLDRLRPRLVSADDARLFDEHLAARDAPDPPRAICGDDLAYIEHTSGSSGEPNGVLVTHRGLASYLAFAVEAYGLSSGLGAPVHTPLTFDLTITSLLAPLVAGAETCLLAGEGPAAIEALDRALSGPGDFALVKLTPSHLEALHARGRSASCAARALIVGGENLLAETIAPWRRAGGPRIINEYGPTEAVVGCAIHEVRESDPTSGSIPIGRPIPGAELYLLDAEMRLVPRGTTGEIYIGGDGLARGYLGDPRLTAERFVPHPFARGERLYKSGDLARLDRRGELVFLGRADDQVKIRGHRVELGEIESALRRHPAAADACAVAREHTPAGRQLIAYVVPSSEHAPIVRRRLELERERPEVRRWMFELPDGRTIAHLNRGETEHLYRDLVEREIYLAGGIELDDGDCVFDVGANIGLFSLHAHALAERLRIFAFEPIPAIFERLEINAQLYGLNATLLPFAAGERAGSATFAFYPRVSSMSGRYSDAARDRETVRRYEEARAEFSAEEIKAAVDARMESELVACRMTTLSDVIREHRVERIDLLKVDVERSELDVLAGIGESDWPKIRQLAVEVHDLGGRLAHISELLERRGFAIAVEQTRELSATELFMLYATRERRARKERARRSWTSRTRLVSELGESLRADLPEYMLPASIVLIDSLPLTKNGKIDRAALPSPAELSVRELVPPRSRIERTLVEVWKSVFGLGELGVTESFFELGGHSLLAIRLAARASKALGVNVDLGMIFAAPTIGELAAAIENQSERRAPAWACASGEGALVIEPRSLIGLIASGELKPARSAAVTCLPSSILRSVPRELIDAWCGGRPQVSSILETELGSIAVLMLPVFETELYEDRERTVRMTIDALDLAATLGARVVSLAGLIPSATEYGAAVARARAHDAKPEITTGHATTAAAVALNVAQLVAEAGRELSRETLGVLGLGSIGNAALSLVAGVLPHPERIILCDVPARRDVLERARRMLIEQRGFTGEIELVASARTAPERFYESTLIIGATNAPGALLVDRLRPGTLIADDSDPPCFDAERAFARLTARADLLFTDGGVLESPSAVRRILHLPAGAEQLVDRHEIETFTQADARRLMGCSFSSLLSAHFADLRPQIGLVDFETSSLHHHRLLELGYRGSPLRCRGRALDASSIAQFRSRFAP